jgi:hypothetical protein
VLNLETNQIVETCVVTFDETQPHSSLVFDCAGDDELGEEIFQEDMQEHGDDDGGGDAPATDRVPTTSTTTTTIEDGPSPTPMTTCQVEAAAKGEVVSRREAPRCVQVDHPASRIIGYINEHTTRSRSRNTFHYTSHFS